TILRIFDSPSKLLRALRSFASLRCELPQSTLKNFQFILSHVTFAVTGTLTRRTIARLCQLTIRANAGLCVDAPKVPRVRGRHRWIVRHPDEHPLPSKALAQIWMVDVKAFGFVDHFAPPAAASTARLTATRASWIL